MSSSTAFTYQVRAHHPSTCGFNPTSWSFAATSSNNPTSVINFQKISSTGLYSAGPFPDNSNAGIYNVSVTSVTINGVVYSTTSTPPAITNTAATPNSFLLTAEAVDPCLTATVSASSVADISI
jgi:hypothetical protein